MWWLVGVALADPPAGLRLVAASENTPDAHAQWRAARGESVDPLACARVWPGYAQVCLRVWEPADGAKRRRRWVTEGDLTRWKVTLPDALSDLVEAGTAHLAAAVERPIVGLGGRYLELQDADGWEAVALLDPAPLVARLGGAPIAVALPQEGVLLAWKPGQPEQDLAMAVGVRELAVGEGRVTDVVFGWDGRVWAPYVVAQPSPGVSP